MIITNSSKNIVRYIYIWLTLKYCLVSCKWLRWLLDCIDNLGSCKKKIKARDDLFVIIFTVHHLKLVYERFIPVNHSSIIINNPDYISSAITSKDFKFWKIWCFLPTYYFRIRFPSCEIGGKPSSIIVKQSYHHHNTKLIL